VKEKVVIADKKAIEGVKLGVPNLIKVAEKYNAKVTFAVCPEVVEYFPKNAKHEIGLHIHPGWHEFLKHGITFHAGDLYLRRHCKQSTNSTVLRDYTYEEQLGMISKGKQYLEEKLRIEPKSFVAGRWSINNDTVKALIESEITHECSAPTHSRAAHYDWSRLPRICMPYYPSERDYQSRGMLPLLIVPISNMLFAGNVNPEVAPFVGLSWLKACFLEYYNQNLPLFHICLHSPCMTDPYFIMVMDNLLKFISSQKNIDFRFASDIEMCDGEKPKTNIMPYLLGGINKNIIERNLVPIKSMIFGEKRE